MDIRLQLVRFIVSGCFAVLTDYAVYISLYKDIGHSPAKLASFMAGTGVAYFLNKFWTFAAGKTPNSDIWKFAVLYMSTLIANVMTNKAILLLNFEFVGLAFMAGTAVSTIVNFWGMRLWVFRKREA